MGRDLHRARPTVSPAPSFPLPMLVRRLTPLLFAAAILSGGCYTLQPITTAPPAGANIVVVLSSAGTDAVTSIVGPRATRITGDVRSANGEMIEIDISEVVTLDGQSYYLRGSTVSLGRNHMASVQMRSLDRRRTVVVGVAVVFSAAAIIAGVRFAGGGADGTGGGGGTPALVPPR